MKKLFIFRDATSLDFFRIAADSPMLAIRELVRLHGQRPYVIVAIA